MSKSGGALLYFLVFLHFSVTNVNHAVSVQRNIVLVGHQHDGIALGVQALVACAPRLVASDGGPSGLSNRPRADTPIPLPGRALLEVALSFTYCRDGVGGLCKLGTTHWTVPVEIAPTDGAAFVPLTAEVATD